MRVTLSAVDAELTRRGIDARVAKDGNYFYFHGGYTETWLDKTVKVSTVGSLTVNQWLAEFDRLQKLNQQLLGAPAAKKTSSKKGSTKK